MKNFKFFAVVLTFSLLVFSLPGCSGGSSGGGSTPPSHSPSPDPTQTIQTPTSTYTPTQTPTSTPTSTEPQILSLNSSFGESGSGLNQMRNPVAVGLFGTYILAADQSNRRWVEWYMTGESFSNYTGQIFSQPNGIAGDSTNGLVYISNKSTNSSVEKYTHIRQFISKIGVGILSSPEKITLDAREYDSSIGAYRIYYILVADSQKNRIFKFNAAGGLVFSLDYDFSAPKDVAVDSSGNIYVADTGNHCVKKFDANGGFLLKIGRYGTGRGEFNSPVAVNTNDYQEGSVNRHEIFVCDRDNLRIQKFKGDGSYISLFDSRAYGRPIDMTGGSNFPAGYILFDQVDKIYNFDIRRNTYQY